MIKSSKSNHLHFARRTAPQTRWHSDLTAVLPPKTPAPQLRYTPASCFPNSVFYRGGNQGWMGHQDSLLPPDALPMSSPSIHAYIHSSNNLSMHPPMHARTLQSSHLAVHLSIHSTNPLMHVSTPFLFSLTICSFSLPHTTILLIRPATTLFLCSFYICPSILPPPHLPISHPAALPLSPIISTYSPMQLVIYSFLVLARMTSEPFCQPPLLPMPDTFLSQLHLAPSTLPFLLPTGLSLPNDNRDAFPGS